MELDIDVYSDPICPWCYIGKRRLERALAARPEIVATVRWRAFQLNPAMPEAGMERRTYLNAKFGSAQEAARLYNHIRAVGIREGIDFQFDAITRTPNTVPAHALVRFAEIHDAQDPVAEALFRAFFLEGRDIGDELVLQDIAAECGLDKHAFETMAADRETLNRIQDEDMQGRRIGIDGVPFFVIDGQYALSGAQEPEAFYNIFDLVSENRRAGRAAVG